MRHRPVAVFVLLLALVASACGGERVRFQAPTPTPPPTVAASPTPSASPTPQPSLDPSASCHDCWPLTGMPLGAGDATRRPLVVKIDNAPAARPHYGIAEADIVIEQLVEGYVTRLVAIYHSRDPQTIGSVRSARLADRSLSAMVQGALVYSGTSAYAWERISADAAAGRYVELSADHSPGYQRVGFRIAPYNLFTSAKAQRDALAALGKATVGKVPRWSFLAVADRPATAGGMDGDSAATEIAIPYRQDTSAVRYEYDGLTHTYARWQHSAGKPVREVDDANNTPVAAANVVIVHTDIWEIPEIVDASGARAHDMRLLGTGRATIFRDGLRQDGTWSRETEQDAFRFRTPAGEEIELSTGQTWLHIIPTDWVVTSR
jgi:hypothetical protein